jgi:hypothetical protein
MRKHLSIKARRSVIIEQCAAELRLKPAAVLELEQYTGWQSAEWDCAYAPSADQRTRILARLQET